MDSFQSQLNELMWSFELVGQSFQNISTNTSSIPIFADFLCRSHFVFWSFWNGIENETHEKEIIENLISLKQLH